jgi:hypothetical protein
MTRDMGSDNSEEDRRKMTNFVVPNVILLMYVVVLSYIQCQQFLPANVYQQFGVRLLNIRVSNQLSTPY